MATDTLDIKDNHNHPSKFKSNDYLKYESKCKICNLRNPYTLEYLRETIEAAAANGVFLSDIVTWIKINLDVDISIMAISSHLTKHAIYTKRINQDSLKSLIAHGKKDIVAVKPREIIATGVPSDAFSVMQEIVDVGRQKILDGEIQIDGKMLIQAANVIAKMNKESGYDSLIKTINKKRFNNKPEVLEGKVDANS